MKLLDRVQRFGKKAIGVVNKTTKKVIGSSIVQNIRTILSELPDITEFVGETKRLIEQHGLKIIKSIQSCRVPLSGALQGIIKAFHAGKIAVDKFFHLYMKIGLDDGTSLIYEKNERPMMSVTGAPRKEEDCRPISVSPGLSLATMIENGIEKYGKHNYFVYDPFKLNCQHFQIANMTASPQIHITAEDRAWIDQDAGQIAEHLPEWAKSGSAEIIQDFAKLTGLFH